MKMIKIMKGGKYLSLCLSLIFFSDTLAQSSSILEKYIQEALIENLDLKSIQLTQERQNSVVLQAKKGWQPKLNLDATYLFARGGRTIVFPVGDLFNPAYGALNRLTGTEEFPTNLENFESQLTPNNYLDASLSVSKPLINSAIKHNILIQKALVGLSDADRQIQRNEITFQVKQAYFNYLKTIKGQEIVEENIFLLKEVLEFNKKLIKYDKATPDANSDVLFQIARLESEAEALVEQSALSAILFNTVLNRDIEEDIELDTSFYQNLSSNKEDLKNLVSFGLSNRAEFRKLEIANYVNDLNRKRIEGAGSPTLGVKGALGVQSQDFSFDEGGPLYTIGFNLGWNIWDGGLRKQQLAEIKIANAQNELETQKASNQITLQIAQSYHHLRALYAQLASQTAAISAARISYDAIDNKYKNSRALLIELLTAQNNLANSKLNKVLLNIDILIGEADLERLTNNQ